MQSSVSVRFGFFANVIPLGLKYTYRLVIDTLETYLTEKLTGLGVLDCNKMYLQLYFNA